MCVLSGVFFFFFFFKQKTAYEMRISDWSSDVCSSDLGGTGGGPGGALSRAARRIGGGPDSGCRFAECRRGAAGTGRRRPGRSPDHGGLLAQPPARTSPRRRHPPRGSPCTGARPDGALNRPAGLI